MTGNYLHNNVDSVESVNDATSCQKLCQEHSQCKFWTYDYSNKKCYRQTEKAATALGTCKTCIRGPRSCSGKIIRIEIFSNKMQRYLPIYSILYTNKLLKTKIPNIFR